MSKILKKLRGPLSTLDKKNRNGRIYSRELWELVLGSEYWEDMTSNKSLMGECVHPGDRTESDPLEIDARNVSHRVTDAKIEGDKLMGTVEILDTDAGRNLLNLVDSGCTVGISARGTGDLDGDYVIPDSYQFKCFDITFRPSDPNARLIPLTESEKKNVVIIKESDETDDFTEKQELLKGSDISSAENMRETILGHLLETLNQENDIEYTFEVNVSNNSIKILHDGKQVSFVLVGVIESEADSENPYVGVVTNPFIGKEYIYASDLHNVVRYREIKNKLIESLR